MLIILYDMFLFSNKMQKVPGIRENTIDKGWQLIHWLFNAFRFKTCTVQFIFLHIAILNL